MKLTHEIVQVKFNFSINHAEPLQIGIVIKMNVPTMRENGRQFLLFELNM